jgi:DEAD/DEAH box helicase domain-containing protein
MLPLQQAYEVQHSILEYLKATFSFKDQAVHEAFYRFVTDSEEGIFKGPYVSLKLPFVKAGTSERLPLDIAPNLSPYHHQLKSFQRLTTEQGNNPAPTLITTGTSSGKTECFLYPILDYCFKNNSEKGIKVIILYPMNALATDQAKRLAETIWENDRLKGKITAGLFIGEGKGKNKFPSEMGENNVIENRESIVENPPDILLTNFKMLDYALMRNQYHNLWLENFKNPKLLKFLVLDELHTYDGAQGTDVANLIRRLKLKLGIPKGQICPIGTSATIGSGTDAASLLTEYATKIFGEAFDTDAVITENRLTVDAFFDAKPNEIENFIPRPIGIVASKMQADETYNKFIARQKTLWQIPEQTDDVKLGVELKKLQIVRDLVSITSKGLLTVNELVYQLAEINGEFRRLPEWDEPNKMNPREEIINSLLSLISAAKIDDGKPFPFLYLQIQIWIRELTGVLREINDTPKFLWKDHAGGRLEPKALPAYFCRECGASGWLGVKDDNKNHFFDESKQVYDYFFSNHKNLYFINSASNKPVEEYDPDNLINNWMHRIDLSLFENSGKHTIQIIAVRKLKENKTRHICPECNTENAMATIGTRIATLSSVTVAQVLSSDLDHRFDKERKILAFTNSVQDAAHQAGFVEARNFRFTFRASLQKIINVNNESVRLNELQEKFLKFWKEKAAQDGQNNEEAYYYRFLPADYNGKLDLDRDYRDATKKLTHEFKHEFDLRVGWEITSEFSYNAKIGRTLEKTGSSGVEFKIDKLKEVYYVLRGWLDNNNLSIVDESNFLLFTQGILHRIRIRGGIDHTYLSKYRAGALKLWDLNWNKDYSHFLNPLFHPRARFPKLITHTSHAQGMLDTTFTNSNNWFRSYFLKSFPLAPSYHNIINEFYINLLDAFCANGIMNKVTADRQTNYAINPSEIWISNKVNIITCDVCGGKLHTASENVYTLGVKCLSYSCLGTYVTTEVAPPNYYQLVYNRNLSPRIYATEHTGVLERKDRERKEIDFKTRPRFNSLNTILATSTLEMGIDIGTLNSVINNSVPPLTANFLQRVGRAGRSSGSALITNFAQGKAHDLYYYGEPKDMMEGEIATPGCFLEAKEILNRHFFAFCLDYWAKVNPKQNRIPGSLFSLRIGRTDIESPEFWPNMIASFIKSNEIELLEQFSNFYQPDLIDEKPIINLKEFILEGGFYFRLKNIFIKLKAEYVFIASNISELDEAIKKLPHDSERLALESEKKALFGLKRMLDKRSLLEHLTNVGLLPNYAFPESGITLNAHVKSFAAKASISEPFDKQFEIVRSANVAIREMAPDNYFYSQGYRFAISGLKTYDWKDSGVLREYRFCSNCDHIAFSEISKESSCPKCMHESWSSEKNKHYFVKMSGVKSINLRDKASLNDEKDERQNEQYRMSRHLRFDKNAFMGAFGMKEIPFGIEFVKNVQLIEINLGVSSSVHANKITINKIDEVPWHGFVTCRYCGKSTSKVNIREPQFHYQYCKHKDKKYEGLKNEMFEELYLLREVHTEALKIILPVQEFESEATVNMFKAGLELGLKKYYKGNPQHVNMLNYSEFNEKNSRFDKYLVLIDTIPGGTGYLEKLFNTTEFTIVLQKAYEAIRDCICKSKGKDGCYRCIYTYSNQNIQNELSRQRAEKLFKKIIDKSNEWESFAAGLGSLTSNGQIEESELELRFIKSLKLFCEDNHENGYDFTEYMEDGIVNYRIIIPSLTNKYHYLIRPQVSLGPAADIAISTRVDFLISLSRISNLNDEDTSDSRNFSFKSIAIYLDGYTYHASEEHNRVVDDIRKRLAIVASGAYISWTLTWTDLDLFDNGLNKGNNSDGNNNSCDILFPDKIRFKQSLDKIKNITKYDLAKDSLIGSKNSVERLLWNLQNPFSEKEKETKTTLLLALRQEDLGFPALSELEFDTYLSSSYEQDKRFTFVKASSSETFFLMPQLPCYFGFATLKIGVKLNALMLHKGTLKINETKENIDKETWENFWAIFNIIQDKLIE